MGIAAYNRSSSVVKGKIDDEKRPMEFELMEELNNLPKHPDATEPPCPVKFVCDSGEIWWCVTQEKGFAGYGYWYKKGLRDAVRYWNVDIVGFENGEWIACNRPRKTKDEYWKEWMERMSKKWKPKKDFS